MTFTVSNSLTLHDLLFTRAERHPDRVAVRDAGRSITYGRLADDARALAGVLRARRLPPGARIGLYLGRSYLTVVAVTAVLAAGHAYVALDPRYPRERLRFMVDDAGIGLILADRPLDDLAAELPAPVIRLDEPAAAAAATGATGGAAPPVSPDACAYVIYTSGSTGRPKGVEISHANVLALLAGCREIFDFGEDDVWTLFHSYCFDFSVWEFWGALLSGARLVVVGDNAAASPKRLIELLATERVTVLSQVPSVFGYTSAAARSASPERRALLGRTVRHVVFGGEPLDLAAIGGWRRSVGRSTAFTNMYGITETTVFATYRHLTGAELARIEDGEAPAALRLDIGEPLTGWDVVLLDADLRPVGPGEVGEIHICGPGVSRGYLGRPELTAERFVELPAGGASRRFYRSGDLARRRPDGGYDFAGRADDQVKLNGYRIELGEVESVLREEPGVADLAVVAARSPRGERLIQACYTPAPGVDGLPTALAARARRMLPAYAVPARFVAWDRFPLNASGKVDRRALADAGPRDTKERR